MPVDTPLPESEDAWLRQRAVRGGTIFLAARLTAQVFQWGVTLVVARLLVPDDYGMMTTGAVFVGLADTLAGAGVGKALIQRKKLSDADLAQCFSLSLILAATLYAGLFALAPLAAAFLAKPDFTPFLRVLALLLLLVPICSVTNAQLERDLQLGKQSVIQVGAALVQAVLVLSLASAGLGYWALATGALLTRCIEVGSLWYLAGWRPRVVLPDGEAVELLRYGIHVSSGALLWFVYTNADFAVVGALLGTSMLGYYSLAFQLVSLPVEKLSATINQVMFAVFCKIQDDRARVRNWYLRLTILMTFVGAPTLAGLALVAEDGIPLLLGERWRDAVLPFRLLCPVGVLMMASAGLHQVFGALGRPDLTMKYSAASAVLFPASFLLMGSAYGLVGVCIVWLVLYPAMFIGLVHLTRHLTGISVGDLLQAHVSVLAGVAFMCVCVLGIQAALPSDTRWEVGARLAAAIATGVVAYTGWILTTARQTVLADLRRLRSELRGQ
jgi:O-antigen/teichoic acid export membrane protein